MTQKKIGYKVCQYPCGSETPFPECVKEAWCDGWGRFCCMLWDIFNIDRDYCDSEMRKQKHLEDFQIIGVAAVNKERLERNLGVMNRSKEPTVVAISGPLLQVNVLDYLGEKSKQERKDAKTLKKLRGYYSKSKEGSKNPNSKKYRR